MTNFKSVSLNTNNAGGDAFGRVRVSQPITIFDSKLLNGLNTDTWDSAFDNTSGAGSETFDTNKVTLTVGANAADFRIRQTKMRFNYLPGKSQLIYMTFALGEDAGTTKRVGYFNASTVSPYTASRDGLYLEHDGTSVYVVQEKSGVTTNTRISQANWNLDTMGAGALNPSGITIDWADAQIMVIDFEWLGVGRVRFGFNIDGVTYYVHQFNNANGHIQAITEPYMDSANHSLRYEIYSNGSAGSLVEICGSVQSEGGYELIGNLYSADRGITPFSTGSNTSIHPLLSLRIASGRPDGTLIALSSTIACTSTSVFRWALLLNPTVGGADAASWVAVGGNSSVEYDVSRTNVNVLTGGTQIASGYAEDAGGQANGSFDVELNSALRPGIGIDGRQDELVLAVQNISAADESYLAAINWREPL